MKTGKVYLIGAGPGDIELLTLKAVRALGIADVVLIDDLVNRQALDFVRPGARVIDVGKRGGSRAALTESPKRAGGNLSPGPQAAGNVLPRPRDTLAAGPFAGAGAKARYPQAGGFATGPSPRHSRSDQGREMDLGRTSRERVPSALTCPCAVSVRPRDTLAAGPFAGAGAKARCLQTRANDVSARRCRSTPQAFIERLMIAEAKVGCIVARVKGGDPFVFGRGGEEMLALRAAGVAFEIISGITAGIAAPAALGIPVTHRDYTLGVIFVTGHSGSGSEPDWNALARCGMTLVIYMGLGRLEKITAALLAAGLSAATPAAAIQNGTLSQQKNVVASLGNLSVAVRGARLASPAIIVVGKVVDLAQVALIAARQAA